MDERDIRFLVAEVRRGRLSRREFVSRLTAAGLTAPLAARILGPGRAHAQPRATFTPTKRGGGGPLRVLWWQAPTLLNPHFANGTKHQDACRVFYEPLAGTDPDGNVVPILATDVPTVDNGGLARDGTWVVWRRRPASTRATRAGSSTSTGPTRSSTRPAGGVEPMAFAPKRASGCASSTRRPSTRRGRRRRRSSSRPARRPVSSWS